MIKGIGIDLVETGEFRKGLSPELIKEVFLPAEAEYCQSQVRYWENFAARFAAKEAVFKALGEGLSSGMRFRDVEVVKDPGNGSVSVQLHGEAARKASEKGVSQIHLSISHTRQSAIAMVVTAGPEQV